MGQHYGEELIHCLSGSAVITVEGDDCVLSPGDTMVFDATKAHSYAPAPDAELPAVIFFVVAQRPNEAEIVAANVPVREKWGV